MARVRIQAERIPDHEPRGQSIRVIVMEPNPEAPDQTSVTDILQLDSTNNDNERMRDLLKFLLEQLNNPGVSEVHVVKLKPEASDS